MSRRLWIAAVAAMAAVVIAIAAFMQVSEPTALRSGDVDRGGEEEAEEQAETTQKRLEALRQARAAGRFGSVRVVRGAAAPGWDGAELMDARTDDWEPAIAADPGSGYVYLI